MTDPSPFPGRDGVPGPVPSGAVGPGPAPPPPGPGGFPPAPGPGGFPPLPPPGVPFGYQKPPRNDSTGCLLGGLLGGGCLGLSLIFVVPIVVALVVMGIAISRADLDSTPNDCTTELKDRCTDIGPKPIAERMRMRLPPGTTVTNSTYQEFQDWNLEAELRIPAAGVGSWKESLTGYRSVDIDPTGTDASDRLTERGLTDVGAAEIPLDQHGVTRSYAVGYEPDGDAIVLVKAFST